jgi:type I restriction enzyme S subunit
MREVKRMLFPCPPISLQKDFSIRLSKIAQQIELHSSSTRTLEALFNSLQHRAFQGEL